MHINNIYHHAYHHMLHANSRSSGHSSTVVHTLLILSITKPSSHSHPGLHFALQKMFGLSHVLGHADAQSEKVCPWISQVHTGQHSPSGTTAISPSRHTGIRQLTAAQSGPSEGRHTGQHSPAGTSILKPCLHSGRAQSIRLQSGWHSGQHSPSGVTRVCPASQTGLRQSTTEQSGSHTGQHSPSGTMGFGQLGKAHNIPKHLSISHLGQHSPSGITER